MLDNKTRNDILLEEKIAKIDDINFDKIYDVDEFATKQLESFESNDSFEDNLGSNKIADIDEDFIQDVAVNEETPAFELELQPNEFLDNMVWGEDDEIEQISTKRKFSLCNKPLFYTFTSIALLLCILFIYNVFVIKSLEAKASLNATPNASISVLQPVEENNNITFENSTTTEITQNANYLEKSNNENSKNNFNTNWFNEVCTFLNKLFGGNY